MSLARAHLLLLALLTFGCASGSAPGGKGDMSGASCTDVGCGGTCPPCDTGKKCNLAADCVSKVCTGGVCQAATCTDSVKNGGETDIDCGGPTCPACANGKVCALPSDCQSNVCHIQSMTGTCIAISCMDGIKNGSETDIDCGGPACSACALGKSCAMPSDCATQVCTNGMCCNDCASLGKNCGSIANGCGAMLGCGMCPTPLLCGNVTPNVCSCVPGQSESLPCGNCGTQTHTCNSQGSWGMLGPCTGEGACAANAMRMLPCGNCGTETDTCSSSCQWVAGTCTNQGACAPTTTRSTPCGLCGTQTDICNMNCQWNAGTTCSNQGVCKPGLTQPCTNYCGIRTCQMNCQWGACPACAGTCPCFCTNGPYCAITALQYGESNNCSVPAAVGNENNLLNCQNFTWSVLQVCPLSCNTMPCGKSDSCN